MASTRSWFSGASSTRSPLLSQSKHELPRWRSPSPMSSSIIPPPIVQSNYPSQHETVAQSVYIQKPSPYDDKQRELEADLQFLLDAQAEGLVRGLEGSSEEPSSTGSTTPTAQSIRSSSNRRSGDRTTRRLGLRSARRGIYKSIVALSNLKDEELGQIDESIREDDATLSKLDGWEKKRERLQQASQQVDTGEDTVRVQRLRQEADSLQVEINKAELHLMEMKSTQRKLLRQVAAVENSVQAKMASYTSSLRTLEDDIQKFLKLEAENHDQASASPNVEQSVWQLPPKERNLDMAKKFWNEQRDGNIRQRRDMQFEKSALVEGAEMWKSVVVEVTDFEKRLRSEMSALPPTSNSQTPWEESHAPPVSTEHLRDLISRLNQVTVSVESTYDTALERNWKLLIAALGAELDALRRGKQILEGVLHSQGKDLIETEDSKVQRTDTESEGDGLIDELNQSFPGKKTARSEASDVEDGPSPDLMFSQQDPDIE